MWQKSILFQLSGFICKQVVLWEFRTDINIKGAGSVMTVKAFYTLF